MKEVQYGYDDRDGHLKERSSLWSTRDVEANSREVNRAARKSGWIDANLRWQKVS